MDLREALGKVHVAMDMVSMNHANRKLKMNRRHLARYRDKMLSDGREGHVDTEDGDDMMVLGDVNIQNPDAPEPRREEPSSGLLPKVLKTAALLATGGGIAAAVPFALDLLTPDAPPAEPGETKVIEKNRREGVRVLEPTVIPPGEG